jgi:hypothetical protein
MSTSNSSLVTSPAALKDEGNLPVNAHLSKGVRIYASPEEYIVVVVVRKRLGSRPVSELYYLGWSEQGFRLGRPTGNTGKNRDLLSLRLLCRCP